MERSRFLMGGGRVWESWWENGGGVFVMGVIEVKD